MDITNSPVPIKYPLYTDQPELSGSWRINKSSIQVIELANCIKALKKVVGTISTEELNIAFNSHADQSMYTANTKTILIDPRFALEAKKFPIPTHDFDVLVAHGIHEAFHNHAESNLVREVIQQTIRTSLNSGMMVGSPQRSLLSVQKLADQISVVGEEVYVDNAARRQSDLLYRYIYKARLAYRGDVTEKDPDWKDPIRAWGAAGIYGILPPDDIEPYILDCLAVFNVLQQNLAGWELEPNKRVTYYRQAAIDVDNIVKKNEIEERLKGGSPQPNNKDPLKLKDPEPPDFIKPDPSNESDDQEEELEDGEEGENPEKQDQSSMDKIINQLKEMGHQTLPTTEEVQDALDKDEEQDDQDDKEENDREDFSPANRPATQNPDYTPDPNTESNPSQLSLTPLHSDAHISEDLAKAITNALQAEMEDITQEILDEYSQENIEMDHVPKTIIWSQSQEDLDPTFDESLARELIWLRQLKNKIGKQIFRSEDKGKLDPTRLHKIKHSDDVFKTSKQRDRQALDLVLVVDASGSMSGQGEKIYQAVKALRHALLETKVISYDSGHSNSIKIQIQMGNSPMRKIKPHGNTPSGPAILAAVKRFPKSLLIHFSDGGANVGPTLEDTFNLIEQNYPDTRIVNVEYPKQRTTSKHDNVETIELTHIDDFPKLIKKVLKSWQMAI